MDLQCVYCADFLRANFFRAYVPRNERLHYLRLIGADTTPFEKNKFQEQRDEEMKEAMKDEGENGEEKEKNGDEKEGMKGAEKEKEEINKVEKEKEETDGQKDEPVKMEA